MNDKPDSNQSKPQEEISSHRQGVPAASDAAQPPPSVGGDHISIGGNVGPASNVGRGSVHIDQFAGHDLIIHNGLPREEAEVQFTEEMTRLRSLIVKAFKAGELSERTARKALGHLEETAKLIAQEEKPPKIEIVRRLQYVADVLDAAVDFLGASGGVAKVLLQAIPVAALLIRLAVQLF